LATAMLMTTIASGRRISAVTILRIMTSGARAIEPLAHFLAGLEERHRLLLHRDVGAGPPVAARPRPAALSGGGAEAAQLDPVAGRHGRDDLPEKGVDDVFHVALVEMRVLRRDALHELGLDHRCCPGLTERIAPPLVPDWRVPKGQETVKVETLHRLHRAPLFQPPRERAQTHGVEGRDHGGVQERQRARPGPPPLIPHPRPP